MRACWLKWVGRDWSISADYIWLNYSDANTEPCSRPSATRKRHKQEDQLYLTADDNDALD